MEELEKWLTALLSEGLVVNQQFPCKYAPIYGFGYEVVVEGPNRKKYAIIFTRITEEDPLIIHQVNEVNWDKPEDEEITLNSLNGKEMTLECREARKYWSESSKLAITGRLYLK